MALQVFSYQGDDYNSPVNVPAFPLLESAGFFSNASNIDTGFVIDLKKKWSCQKSTKIKGKGK